MGKRKAGDANGKPPKRIDDEDDSGTDEDMDMLDVDFEWFDPQEQDFHGIKSLLRQLLDIDNDLFDLSALTDLILSQPLLGSTVKCDGSESDPYAFLTVLNLKQHASNPVIQSLQRYLSSRSHTNASLTPLATLLRDPSAEVGLVLTERLINMPSEISPPMYTMLLEELTWALEEKEPYNFTHYVILSKTYTEVTSDLMTDDEPKRKKSKAQDAEGEVFYFHPEDEVFARHAVCAGGWRYEKEGNADAKRAFQEAGIRPGGHAIVIEKEKFEGAVAAVGQYMGAPVQS